MDKLFLIDAYALIYRAYFAFIKNPRINSKGMNTSPIMGFCNTLHEVLEKEKPDYIAVAFDPHGPTFRHEAYAPYKAQREKTPEDITASVPIIMDILKAMNIEIFMQAGFEADDVIGTLAKKAAQHSIQVFMLTPDKDYGQLVDDNIYMYKPRFGSGYDVLGPKEITAKYDIQHPEQVIDILALMGDSADNFPGCPGIGEVTAKKLIIAYMIQISARYPSSKSTVSTAIITIVMVPIILTLTILSAILGPIIALTRHKNSRMLSIITTAIKNLSIHFLHSVENINYLSLIYPFYE